MATEYITADLVGEGIQIQRDAPDANLVIDSGVLVGSTNNDAIVLTGSFHDVLVRGTVSGLGQALRLGDEPTQDRANTLRIARDGFVQGDVLGVAFQGAGTIVNDGAIAGFNAGATFTLGGTAVAALTNRGTISAHHEGVWVAGTGLTSARLTNTGVIEATGLAYRSQGCFDVVVNRGVMRGDVLLDTGEDVFDNRGGLVEGIVSGGGGHDTFYAGAGVDLFQGNEGTDTLDFRGSAGQRVSLADDSGTGLAEGDSYTGFERVLGSRGGADTLIGDGAANILYGFGANDSLAGGGGADRLIGGLGVDRLSGGLGDDRFIFGRAADGGDTIADWGARSGDNDRFEISASGFGSDLVAGGALAPGRFQARADNRAQDGDDRFIFRTTDATLWFDADGTGSAAAVLIADLQAVAVVTAADILLY